MRQLEKNFFTALTTQKVRGTTAFIAIEQDLERRFNILHIRPAIKSKELLISAAVDRKIVDEKINRILFIGKNKLLVQFNSIP